MPELPEIETVKNTLKQVVLNKTILSVDVRYDKILKNKTKTEIETLLINQTIEDIKRRGKYLIFVLTDYYLISHLRMEGKFILEKNNDYSKHEHVVFHFSDSNLRYHDTRKFGTMHLYTRDVDIINEIPLSNVGPEPYEVTSEYLQEKFKKSHRPIKSTLLDQKIISGLGNIYVDEVLFMSKLNPLRDTSSLTLDDINNIITNSIIVLNKAIALGGTTIRSFSSGNHISGKFQNELLIHTKKICPTCNIEIKKIYVGGRGTYHCHICQKN